MINEQESHMNIKLSITDTGKGMSKSFIKTGDCYKPFVQADSRAEGVGLGMSIVKTFVEKSNGRLSIDSEIDRGTTISVELPLLIDSEGECSRSAQKVHAALNGKQFYMTQDQESQGNLKLKQSLVETCSQEFGMIEGPLDTADLVISLSVLRVRELFKQGCRAPCLLAASVRDWTQTCPDDPLVHLVQLPLGPGKLFLALSKVCKQLDQSGSRQKPTIATTKPSNAQHNATEAGQSQVKRARAAEDNSELTITTNTMDAPPARKIHKPNPTNPLPSLPILTRPRVLCVDDNKINLRILQTVVAKQRVPHESALDGIEAVTKYTTAESKFDLIFMDVNMPRKNGLDATQEIRRFEKQNDLPPSIIIGLSAGGSAQHKFCLDAGMDGYCDKPVSVQALASMIKTWQPTSSP